MLKAALVFSILLSSLCIGFHCSASAFYESDHIVSLEVQNISPQTSSTHENNDATQDPCYANCIHISYIGTTRFEYKHELINSVIEPNYSFLYQAPYLDKPQRPPLSV